MRTGEVGSGRGTCSERGYVAAGPRSAVHVRCEAAVLRRSSGSSVRSSPALRRVPRYLYPGDFACNSTTDTRLSTHLHGQVSDCYCCFKQQDISITLRTTLQVFYHSGII